MNKYFMLDQIYRACASVKQAVNKSEGNAGQNCANDFLLLYNACGAYQ